MANCSLHDLIKACACSGASGTGCPKLKSIDAGFTCGQITEASLLAVGELLQGTTSVKFGMKKVTDTGVSRFIKLHGNRLVELCIKPHTWSGMEHYLSDATLKIVSNHCPSLTELFLSYGDSFAMYNYQNDEDGVTDQGVIAVLTKCQLRRLRLDGFRNLGTGNASIEMFLGKNKDRAAKIEYLRISQMISYQESQDVLQLPFFSGMVYRRIENEYSGPFTLLQDAIMQSLWSIKGESISEPGVRIAAILKKASRSSHIRYSPYAHTNYTDNGVFSGIHGGQETETR